MDRNARDYEEALRTRLATVEPCPEGRFSGRGIVVCAGGATMFTNAWVLVHVLRRRLASTLPVEVWHFGPEEIAPGMARLLESLDAAAVDACAVLRARPADIADGWQLKPYALMHARFAEVLLLDADQVPAVDPAALFDWPEYREAGAVFWPDRIDLSVDNPIWSTCGLPPRRLPAMESGQVLVDKRRHWQALEVCLHFNENAEHYYRMLYGDKDTFLAAWLATGHAYRMVPHRPYIDERCLFQRDFAGAVVFQHRTGAKWDYAGPQRDLAGFVHGDACDAALDDLRAAWNGRIFNAPARSERARAAEEALQDAGRFVLLRPGKEDAVVEFLPGHQLGEGRSHDRQNWYVADGDDGGLVLEIVDMGATTFRFAGREDGVWRGEEMAAPGCPAELRPAAPASTARRASPRRPVDILGDERFYLKP